MVFVACRWAVTIDDVSDAAVVVVGLHGDVDVVIVLGAVVVVGNVTGGACF